MTLGDFHARVEFNPSGRRDAMLPTHAVGIDLGTTYSCIAYLNEHGEPVTISNRDGELSTPSVVMFDGDQVIVGTEALRNSIRSPDKVVMHAKRHMGDSSHTWDIGGQRHTPVDISTFILRQLLADAEERIGKVNRAVITVPAQFSDVQRQATVEAGRRAGLEQVDIINEPVAAALCFVLGTEGIWFTELATAQTIMVVDLGGGTFDLSLVKYEKNSVSVKASGGDLHLGGIDWNAALEKAILRQFQKEFGVDAQRDRESRQALSLEVEQAKRSLSVRSKAALTCQHGGHRKTYQIDVAQFERIAQPLLERMRELTQGLLKDHKMGWAHVDVVLTTGGASRMPMVRSLLKNLSGRTLNSTLSPDQSIAHGATYYAGMLLSNSSFAKSILSDEAASRLRQFKQQSANARALGILVRDSDGAKVPCYLLPANTQLPAVATQTVGTVVLNQRRAHLAVVESGTAADATYVPLGDCVVEPLPENLPEGSAIEVTIRYDEQARVHVSAKVLSSGQEAQTEIVRPENLMVSAISEETPAAAGDEAVTQTSKPVFSPVSVSRDDSVKKSTPPSRPETPPAAGRGPRAALSLEHADAPIPLCNECGEALDSRGRCRHCQKNATAPAKPATPAARTSPGNRPAGAKSSAAPKSPPGQQATAAKRPVSAGGLPAPTSDAKSGKPSKSPRTIDPEASGEDEFFKFLNDD